MKKLLMTGLIVASLVVAGCSHVADQTGDTPANTAGAPAADQKSGTTTKTGTISQSGELFFLAAGSAAPEPIESNLLDLSNYVGQTVTVSGQYSGDTLFVGEIQ